MPETKRNVCSFKPHSHQPSIIEGERATALFLWLEEKNSGPCKLQVNTTPGIMGSHKQNKAPVHDYKEKRLTATLREDEVEAVTWSDKGLSQLLLSVYRNNDRFQDNQHKHVVCGIPSNRRTCPELDMFPIFIQIM